MITFASEKGNLIFFQSAADCVKLYMWAKKKKKTKEKRAICKCQILTEISASGLESVDTQL